IWSPHLPSPLPVMSEETRQHKLAVGKKILLEHQQKRNPGAKKKNKSQNGSKTTTAKDCHSFEDILKVPGWQGQGWWRQGVRVKDGGLRVSESGGEGKGSRDRDSGDIVAG
uniref:Uncharacterized protein n=1 Tax=Castor canadensis TaxID=51338 RepID=A0A8C0VWE5_CASCN